MIWRHVVENFTWSPECDVAGSASLGRETDDGDQACGWPLLAVCRQVLAEFRGMLLRWGQAKIRLWLEPKARPMKLWAVVLQELRSLEVDVDLRAVCVSRFVDTRTDCARVAISWAVVNATRSNMSALSATLGQFRRLDHVSMVVGVDPWLRREVRSSLASLVRGLGWQDAKVEDGEGGADRIFVHWSREGCSGEDGEGLEAMDSVCRRICGRYNKARAFAVWGAERGGAK